MSNFLNPEEISLAEIFQNQYYIPVYQRPYNWGREQIREILNDIDEAFQNFILHRENISDLDAFLFIGTMFIMPDRDVKEKRCNYDVIDGQQRITTLVLLLMAILNDIQQNVVENPLKPTIRALLWKDENKDCPILTLGQRDKLSLNSLYDQLFTGADILSYAAERIKEAEKQIDKNLYMNFIEITNFFKQYEDTNLVIDYVEFLLNNVRAITIRINTKSEKLFTIFESINSKGKKLEQIDLIKSYIFQNLKPRDYDEYLEKWGKLIWETNDHLAEYLTVFIRANITYIVSEVTLSSFKKLAQKDFADYYQKDDSVGEILKAFINDLIANVRYYSMLSDPSMLRESGVSEKALAYLLMSHIADYKSCEPFLFKLLILRPNYISNSRFETLVADTFRFMLGFQSLSDKKSNDSAKVFKQIQELINEPLPKQGSEKSIVAEDVNLVNNIFEKNIYNSFIEDENLLNKIKNLKYTENASNTVLKIILAFLNVTDNENQVNYIALNEILTISKAFKVETILPANPDRNNESLRYYRINDHIRLKPNQDFVPGSSKQILPASEFLLEYIYRLGNLRLKWGSKTVQKAHESIDLKDDRLKYTTNKEVNEREGKLVNELFKSELIIRPSIYSPLVEPNQRRSKIEISRKNYDLSGTNVTGYKPVSFRFRGEEYKLPDGSSWKECCLFIFHRFYEENEQKLRSLAQHKRPREGKIYLSNNEKEPDFKCKGMPVDTGVYITSALSGMTAVRFIFEIYKELKFNLELDDLTIVFEKR